MSLRSSKWRSRLWQTPDCSRGTAKWIALRKPCKVGGETAFAFQSCCHPTKTKSEIKRKMGRKEKKENGKRKKEKGKRKKEKGKRKKEKGKRKKEKGKRKKEKGKRKKEKGKRK